MISAHELPELMARWTHPDPMASTGFDDLDSVTAGMVPGRVWIVMAKPGEGRTTLLVQWATAIARQPDQHVHLVTPRESLSDVAARLHALLGLIPLNHLTNGRGHRSEQDAGRLARARERIEGLSLALYAEYDEAYVPEVHPWNAAVQPTAVVVDDADMVSGLNPVRVREYAKAGKFVLVSLPRHRVMVRDAAEDLDPGWARVADVVVEVEHRGVGSSGDPRPGEADLHVRYNRHGHLRTIGVQHQAHFSRFLDGGVGSSASSHSTAKRDTAVRESPHALASQPSGN